MADSIVSIDKYADEDVDYGIGAGGYTYIRKERLLSRDLNLDCYRVESFLKINSHSNE